MAKHQSGQKNVHSHHPLFPAGHQTPHGGVRLHGLRVGRRGISTIGKTIRGPKSGESETTSTRVLNEVDTNTRKLVRKPDRSLEFVYIFQQLRSRSCRFVVVCFFFWISRPDSGNCLERDGVCTQNTAPDAHTRTFFSLSVSHRTHAHSAWLKMSQGEKSLCHFFGVHFHLVL